MRRFAVYAVTLFLLGSAFAQKPDAAPSPAAGTSASTSATSAAAAAKPDYSQESFVVEQLRTRYRFESDGTGRKETLARIRVQSEAGVEQWGQIVVGYSSANERIEIPYVRVLKADGTTVTAPPDAVQDLTGPVQREAPVYTDYRQKHITVPGLRPGEVLEYDIVTVIHTPLASGQFWMDHDFDKTSVMLDEQLEIDVPAERKIKLKTRPGFDAKIKEEHGRRVYSWSSNHLQREDEESEKKKKKKVRSEPEAPAVQMTTFENWEEIGKWYAGLERERRQPTAEVRQKADELTRGKTDNLDKIEALYDFVATNFRYISLSFGVGRYQPHSASDVLHNQYGDCKDKHTLLASLLEAEGFHASSVLINSSRKLDADLPSPSQFDHVISLVNDGKQDIWMDTTTEVAPFRLLSYGLRKKQALVIPATGVPHLEETPADPPVPSFQTQSLTGKLNELGKLEAHVKFTVRGDTELLMRMIFRRVPNAQWQKVVETMNRLGGLDGDVTNLKVGAPAATKEPFEVEYDVVKVNYFDWSKKKSELALPLAQVSLAEADDEPAADSEPIKMGPPGEYTYRVKLELPTKYVGHAPVPFSLKRDYGEYQATYSIEGNVLTAERKLVMREREIPSSRAGDYMAFRRALVADQGQRVAIENTVAGSLTPPPNLKADELNESGTAAIQSGNFPLAIELLKRAVEVEPDHKFAWNNLGRAYLGMRENDKAIAAFKKQIEVSPYDEYAYTNLGRAYWADRKYEEAVTAFRKQIEINPLDRFAHSNLGSLYQEWHKYDQAVPELEKAAQLAQDDPMLQVSLGDSYLNLGQDDKALAAFDRAVELSASPMVWNDIAYQLSLKGTHLDRAQQYAESAVAATAAASRNLSLGQLTQRDLGIVSALIAYWDTLGWVYYAKGDFDKAQKYVAAAWQLGQHGEVGDHLGQIYEKQGKKDEAIRAYSLALKAFRPTPETKSRLASLVGGPDRVDSTTLKYGSELSNERTFKLAGPNPGAGTADYFLLFGSGAVVEAAKFVSGDEKLKNMDAILRATRFNLAFPDDPPARVLRRGIVTCPDAGKAAPAKTAAAGSSGTACSVVLLLPDDVRSVD